ncbi:hypothetical protein [Haladaptatus sp. DFWS20]|uniref:hypothetical protein n=1 Tax=Haladaptatus sp. DFWS20 TaxID=3403467 RepID=UPI003EBE4661
MSGDDTKPVTDSAVRAEIRRKYGLPQELDTANDERVLSNALELVAEEQFTAAAAERLSDAFSTVCAKRNPEPRTVNGRPIACHLYDDETRMEDSPPTEPKSE